MTRLQRLMVTFNERHHSLITDGYLDVINTNRNGVVYCKMYHPNGNYVSITAYIDTYEIVQRTNGVISHEEEVR